MIHAQIFYYLATVLDLLMSIELRLRLTFESICRYTCIPVSAFLGHAVPAVNTLLSVVLS